jgi:hypothetical protein
MTFKALPTGTGTDLVLSDVVDAELVDPGLDVVDGDVLDPYAVDDPPFCGRGCGHFHFEDDPCREQYVPCGSFLCCIN